MHLRPFVVVFGFLLSAAAQSAPGGLTISGLPSAAVEDFPVCYDQATGALGRCPAPEAETVVAVSCPDDSIQEAVDNAPPGGRVILQITGTCSESVEILRSHTVLQGIGDAKIVGQSGMTAVRVFRGASDVSIENLEISFGSGVGVSVEDGASAYLQGSTVTNNAGIAVFVRGGSHLDLWQSTVDGGANKALIVADESSANINGTDYTLSSAISPDTGEGTIGVYRTSSILLRGTSTITNTTTDGIAMAAAHGSTIRQDRGFSAITGSLQAINLSTLMIRDAAITGEAKITLNSTMRFRDEDDSTDGTSALNGAMTVGPGSGVQFWDTFTMDGTVTCNGGYTVGSPTFINAGSIDGASCETY